MSLSLVPEPAFHIFPSLFGLATLFHADDLASGLTGKLTVGRGLLRAPAPSTRAAVVASIPRPLQGVAAAGPPSPLCVCPSLGCSRPSSTQAHSHPPHPLPGPCPSLLSSIDTPPRLACTHCLQLQASLCLKASLQHNAHTENHTNHQCTAPWPIQSEHSHVAQQGPTFSAHSDRL